MSQERPVPSAPERGHRVKIVCDSPDYTGARVWIDGREVIDLTSISVRIAVPETNTVSLELIPDELDIEVVTKRVDEQIAGASKVPPPPPPTPGLGHPETTRPPNFLERGLDWLLDRVP